MLARGGAFPRASSGRRGARHGRHRTRSRPPRRGRGGAVCPNLLQRPRAHREARRGSLIFRASARRRSRPGAPLQQIRTRLRPGPPRSSPTRPTRLSIPVLPCGEGPPCAAAADRSGKWRPGRIVPERTSHRSHKNRGIVRKPPSTSGVLARTILPERQNRAREPDETGWGRRPGAIGRGRGPTMTGGADNRGRRAGLWSRPKSPGAGWGRQPRPSGGAMGSRARSPKPGGGQARSTMTGTWSEAPLPLRSSRSIAAPVTRAASAAEP